ncbi:Chaperone DnaJ [Syntrophomonas zehnderi OL-4]|uniref:Chaperone protein DnaJ n=1 Tax=Syntrophomonas zehnderi OL-4 TaxID=690567 RepID=A0A0E4G8Y7_9FIRM|nr:J domain-containing protein [Syntrophomonas zehnderi]CFX01506.1 Chaperone DnaJ [Syntrophomonas zehnderi OL-4]
MAVKYQDYYEILGIPRDASAKDIKAAYRKLARKWHPDLHTGKKKDEAEEKLKRINEAYEVLKDNDKRAKYDRLGENWQAGQEFDGADRDGFHYYRTNINPEDLGGFSDFFASLFGVPGAAGTSPFQSASRPGQDIETNLDLTLEELYHGGNKSIRLTSRQLCPDCQGQGLRGRGFCSRCGGTGNLPEEKNLDIKIPPGVYAGSTIRLKGQGSQGLGGAAAGDLYLKVNLLPHPLFKVQERDLETSISLRPEQAVLGDKVKAPTLEGSVTVTIPAGSRNGSRLRLKGKGLPLKEGGRADQYLLIQIDIPRDLTEEEKNLYRKLKEIRQGGDGK